MTAPPVFYYDLTDPISYLAAERIHAVLEVVSEWEPVLGVELGVAPAAVDPGWLEERADQFGLLPVRLPGGSWGGPAGHMAGRDGPPGGLAAGATAALAATYAKQIGKVVSFSLAAFRQAFAGGADLGQESTVLLAGAASEIHPRALLPAISRPSVSDALRRACDRAQTAGVVRLPAIEVGGSLLSGDHAVEQAAALMSVAGHRAELRDSRDQ